MNKHECLKTIVRNKREWEYNNNVATTLLNLTNDNVVDALKRTGHMITKANNILTDNTTVETDDEIIMMSFDEKIDKMNKELKYEVNGKNTRAYYCMNGSKVHDKVTYTHLFMSLIRYSLLNPRKGYCRFPMDSTDGRALLRFIEVGCNTLYRV